MIRPQDVITAPAGPSVEDLLDIVKHRLPGPRAEKEVARSVDLPADSSPEAIAKAVAQLEKWGWSETSDAIGAAKIRVEGTTLVFGLPTEQEVEP